MEELDGWAVVVGDNACRYFSRNGHDGLEGLFCSDGSYSAGWRVLAAALAIAVISFLLFKMLKPSG